MRKEQAHGIVSVRKNKGSLPERAFICAVVTPEGL